MPTNQGAAGNGISGFAVFLTLAGSIIAYSGLKGKGISAMVRSFLTGTFVPPTSADPNLAITSGQFTPSGTGVSVPTNTPVAGTGTNQAIFQRTAALFGWGSGPEFQALTNLEMHEAGFKSTARNASGAFGLAQALGHGTPGAAAPNGINEYGANYGLTTALAQAANSGDAAAQALWMMGYIKARYGTPSAAWAQYCQHPGGKCFY